MNRNFKIIILNEQSNSNLSLNLNKIFLYIILSVCIILFSFSMWGIYRFFKPHEIQQSVNNNISLKYNTIEFIRNLIDDGVIDKKVINNYSNYESYYNIIPNNMPVEGYITKGLSHDRDPNHFGIDIAAKLKSPVSSAQEGLIIFAGDYENYGKTIIIAHPNNYYTLYSHLHSTSVKQRDYVKAKQIIGKIGDSGKSDGPHLHFEIWKNHLIIDPRELIKEYKNKDVSVK